MQFLVKRITIFIATYVDAFHMQILAACVRSVTFATRREVDLQGMAMKIKWLLITQDQVRIPYRGTVSGVDRRMWTSGVIKA